MSAALAIAWVVIMLGAVYLALRVAHIRRDTRRARVARWILWQIREHGGRVSMEELTNQSVWYPPFRFEPLDVPVTVGRMLASGRLEHGAGSYLVAGVTYVE